MRLALVAPDLNPGGDLVPQPGAVGEPGGLSADCGAAGGGLGGGQGASSGLQWVLSGGGVRLEYVC